MPDSATVISRPIYQEDIALTTNYTPVTVTETVMGLGPTALTPLNCIRYSDLTRAADDVAAAAAGVAVGEVYMVTATGKLRARMT